MVKSLRSKVPLHIHLKDELDQNQQITIGLTPLILKLPVAWMHLSSVPALQQGSWNRVFIVFKLDTHWINGKFSLTPGRAVSLCVTGAVGERQPAWTPSFFTMMEDWWKD